MTLDADIIVIGAGVSGLYTAQLLQKQGFKVIVVEASQVIGGRVRKVDVSGSHNVEVGAEFIHEINVIEELFPDHPWKIKKLITWAQGDGQPKYIPDQLTLYWLEGSKRLINSVNYSDITLDQNGEVIKEIKASQNDNLIKEIQKTIQVISDIEEIDHKTLSPSMSMLEYLKEIVKIENDEALDLFNAGFSNTYCSNSNDLKIRDVVYYTNLYPEEDHEADFLIENGFSNTLIPFLSNNLQIIRNWKVKIIENKNNTVSVINNNNEVLQCQKVVVSFKIL